MSDETFGRWPAAIHADAEQKKRQKSALDKKLSPLELNVTEQKAVFKGSSASSYETTLDSCSCVDFARRALPCKHMYRLAMELKLFPGIENAVTISPENMRKHVSEALTVDQVMDMISVLSEEEQLDFSGLCNSCGNENKRGPGSIRIGLAQKLSDVGLVRIEKILRVNARVVLSDRISENAIRINRAICKKYPREHEPLVFLY